MWKIVLKDLRLSIEKYMLIANAWKITRDSEDRVLIPSNILSAPWSSGIRRSFFRLEIIEKLWKIESWLSSPWNSVTMT